MKYPARTLQNCILYIITLSGAFFCPEAYSQYLQNASLESTEASDDVSKVDYWDSDDAWSDPDFGYTYAPIDGTNTPFPPVDGEYFALLRARGVNYDSTDGEHFHLTREYLYQKLARPLEANSCFELKVSLCYDPHYSVLDYEYPDTAFPVKFQVWGGFNPNDRSVLLVDSDPIKNISWKQYTYHFITPDRDLPYFLIEVAWDTIHVFPKPYCGFSLVDDLSLTYVGKPDETVINKILFLGDNKDILTPQTNGIAYHWYPENVVSDPTARSPVLTQLTDSVKVIVDRENGCPVVEIFLIEPDCEAIYPNGELDTTDFYYKFEKGLQLNAHNGVSWQWDPPTYLSATDIQSPALLDYNEFYQVHIKDKYGCQFVENFHIIWNCDTLYPNGELIVQNDTLTQPGDFRLVPFVGQPISDWSPPNFLSCTDCENPVASPRHSITYSIEMKDNYKCEHTEKFIFNIPLKIPNVITPNGDGSNDCFRVFGLPENTTFYLFDKSGHTICSVRNFETVECWDGSRENLRSGTYWYAFNSPDYGTLAKGFLLIVR